MSLGLYIHIPFCAHLCHYCDFAKTALYGQVNVDEYFAKLQADIRKELSLINGQISSVFFGGGTPGLFAKEYETIIASLKPRLTSTCEISLEANPNNLSSAFLTTWRAIGFNRLSVGVQSFNPTALKFLTRDHVPAESKANLVEARRYFENLNIDIIYGWPNQTPAHLRSDLLQAVDLGVTHLSLYCLTFEPSTPLGRKLKRGVVASASDEHLEALYSEARAVLSEQKYLHEEVSNWALPGYSCKHNWLYWQDEPFIAVGAGAHGYMPEGVVGRRYSYSKDFRKYLKGETLVVESRTTEDWLLEYVGSSLRTSKGTDLRKIYAKCGLRFEPTNLIQQGLRQGLVMLQGDCFVLSPQEWFREVAWSLALIDSLKHS